jgi:hypothetical protein
MKIFKVALITGISKNLEMLAAVYTKYGPPDVLQLKEVEKPTPKEDEVLVRVYASTVNRTDCAMLRAKPFIMRFFTGLFKPKKQFPELTLQERLKLLEKMLLHLKVVIGFLDLMTVA